jgi:hypothetical protein
MALFARKIALVAERPGALNHVRPEHLVITTWGVFNGTIISESAVYSCILPLDPPVEHAIYICSEGEDPVPRAREAGHKA